MLEWCGLLAIVREELGPVFMPETLTLFNDKEAIKVGNPPPRIQLLLNGVKNTR